MTRLQVDNVIGRPAEDGPALMTALQRHLEAPAVFDNFYAVQLVFCAGTVLAACCRIC